MSVPSIRVMSPPERHVTQVQHHSDVQRDDDEHHPHQREMEHVPEVEELPGLLQEVQTVNELVALGDGGHHLRGDSLRDTTIGEQLSQSSSLLCGPPATGQQAPHCRWRPSERRLGGLDPVQHGWRDVPLQVLLDVRDTGTELLLADFGATNGPRHPHVQVASDEAGQGDQHHRPVRDRDQAVELECRVIGHGDGTDDAAEDVDLEPGLEVRRAATTPGEALAHEVHEGHQHQREAGEPQRLPDGSRRTQHAVHGVIATDTDRRRVVAPPVEPDENPGTQQDHRHAAHHQDVHERARGEQHEAAPRGRAARLSGNADDGA